MAKAAMESKRILALSEPSPGLFVKSEVARQEGGLMSASEAYLAYGVYCDRHNTPKAESSVFKTAACELIYERFQPRIRHDIKST